MSAVTRAGAWAPADTRQEVTTEQARSGRYSLKMTVDTTDTAKLSKNTFLFRDGALPKTGYYSAWFLFPQRYQSPSFWTVMLFKGRRDPVDPRTEYANMWGLLVNSRPDGEMAFVLHDRQRARWIRQDEPLAIPVQRWVHVEAYLRLASDATGRIVFWQDGSKIFDLDGLPTAPSEWVSLIIASIAKQVSPSPAVVYVDDVSVASWTGPPP
jgi:hypothetical protein